jgi:hypothetical protein
MVSIIDIPILEGLEMEHLGKCFGYFLRSLGVYFPILVCCTKKKFANPAEAESNWIIEVLQSGH